MSRKFTQVRMVRFMFLKGQRVCISFVVLVNTTAFRDERP